jgi:hypothetical protein
VLVQVVAKGAAHVRERDIVDRRARHPGLDPFEVVKVVEPGLEHPVR